VRSDGFRDPVRANEINVDHFAPTTRSVSDSRDMREYSYTWASSKSFSELVHISGVDDVASDPFGHISFEAERFDGSNKAVSVAIGDQQRKALPQGAGAPHSHVTAPDDDRVRTFGIVGRCFNELGHVLTLRD
jgi:hypothetical protein